MSGADRDFCTHLLPPEVIKTGRRKFKYVQVLHAGSMARFFFQTVYLSSTPAECQKYRSVCELGLILWVGFRRCNKRKLAAGKVSGRIQRCTERVYKQIVSSKISLVQTVQINTLDTLRQKFTIIITAVTSIVVSMVSHQHPALQERQNVYMYKPKNKNKP